MKQVQQSHLTILQEQLVRVLLFTAATYMDGSAMSNGTASNGAGTARGFITLTSDSSAPIRIQDGVADQDSTATGMVVVPELVLSPKMN